MTKTDLEINENLCSYVQITENLVNVGESQYALWDISQDDDSHVYKVTLLKRQLLILPELKKVKKHCVLIDTPEVYFISYSEPEIKDTRGEDDSLDNIIRLMMVNLPKFIYKMISCDDKKQKPKYITKVEIPYPYGQPTAKELSYYDTIEQLQVPPHLFTQVTYVRSNTKLGEKLVKIINNIRKDAIEAW